MAAMKCILGLLALLAVSAWTKARVLKRQSGDNNEDDKAKLSVSEQLERANRNLSEEYNLDKINTLNQETLYDYKGLVPLDNLPFSRKFNLNAILGRAQKISKNDFDRINLLYSSN